MRPCLFVVLTCVLGACQHPSSPPAPEVVGLTLGGRDLDGGFAPLEDGQAVELEAGAQGGFHVWLRYRYAGLPGDSVRLLRTAHRLRDDAIVLRTSAAVTLVAESQPLAMFMCPSPIGLSVLDEPIVFSLDLAGPDGLELARQSITLVPRCPEAERALCLRICSG